MARKILIIAFVAVNVFTFVWMGTDKAIARRNAYATDEYRETRAAEVKIVAVSSFGAAPGTLAGLRVFKHKTSVDKSAFRQALVIVLFQNIISYMILFRVTRRKKELNYTRRDLYGKR